VSTSRPILRVGLTGGIACGKTTVSGFLTELGAHVIDADRIVHELLAAGGDACAEVLARFGDSVRAPDGSIDRKALGAVVFHDAEARRDLDAILHPKVLAETNRLLDRFAFIGTAPIAIVDAALLVETGLHRSLDKLIVLRCSPEAQRKRLLARGLDEKEATARIAAQAPLEEKLDAADYVIDTETTLQATREQTRGVYASLLADFEKEFRA
jgi:dephospho-CoA kinase